jgi:NADH:ubiquinone oxidoreductase subunit 4 (subunit M)
MLTLVQKIFYGPPSGQVTANPEPNALLDLTLGEKLITYSLATIMLVMGICPNLWLTAIQTGVQPAANPPAPVVSLPVSLPAPNNLRAGGQQ